MISISSNKENGFKPDHEANINVIGNDIWFTGDISLVAMSELKRFKCVLIIKMLILKSIYL